MPTIIQSTDYNKADRLLLGQLGLLGCDTSERLLAIDENLAKEAIARLD